MHINVYVNVCVSARKREHVYVYSWLELRSLQLLM